MNGTTRVYGLDVIRAVAITMVVCSHSYYIFQGYDNTFIHLLQIAGVDGVEVFFVLSGFLIGGMLLKLIKSLNLSLKEVFVFYLRRWFRTFPLYFLMLLVNILIALCVGFKLPSTLWKYFLFLQNFSTYHEPFFPESWSLSVEEFAYLIAPICLLFFYVLFKKKEKSFIITSFFLVVVFFILKIYYYLNVSVLQLQSIEVWNSNLKAIVIYRMDSIFYGFILAYYFYKYKSKVKKLKNVFFVLGVVSSTLLLLILPILGVSIESHPFYYNVLYLPLNSISISLMFPYLYFITNPNTWFSTLISKISLYSYAMYLLHYTFILYLMEIFFSMQSLNLSQHLLCLIFYLVSTFFLSKFVYLYFEKPMTDLRDSALIQKFLKK